MVNLMKHPVGGYLAGVVEILNAARDGYALALHVPGKAPVRVTYGNGRYSVAGRARARAAASKAIMAMIGDSAGAAYDVAE